MEVLVIGVGAMGSLLSGHLRLSHNVYAYDLNPNRMEEVCEELGLRPQRELRDLRKFDLALVCTPISEVPRVLKKLGGEMRKGSAIMEISSVKSPVIERMRELRGAGFIAVSFHPLFGPGIRDLSSGRAAVVEVGNLEEEVSLLSSLFPFEIIPMSLEDHDRAMAWLALIHLITNAFLSSSDSYADLLIEASTPTISHFLKLAIAALTQSERLSQELIALNPYFETSFAKFSSELNSKEFARIRAKIRKWRELMSPEEAYASLYE